MKSKVVVGVGVVIVGLVVGVCLMLGNSNQAVEGRSEGASRSASMTAESPGRSDSERVSGVRDFPLRATTSAALADEAQEMSPGQSAYFRLQSTQLCSGVVGDEAKAKAAKDVLGQRTLRFCRDYDPNAAGNWPDFSRLDQTDPVVQTYSAADVAFSLATDPLAKPEEVRAVTSLLEQHLLHSDGGVEGIVAAEAMQQVGYVADNVRKLSADRGWGYSSADLAQAQVLAAQMASCERFGCGAQDFMTLQICNALQSCDATLSLDDAWRRRYGENLMVVARQIAKLGGQ